MYAIVENNEVKQIITNPKSLVIGDVRYPAKIFELWSKSELNAIGIYEVITDSTNKRYVTDANLTTIGNQSGINTGDETITTIKSKKLCYQQTK